VPPTPPSIHFNRKEIDMTTFTATHGVEFGESAAPKKEGGEPGPYVVWAKFEHDRDLDEPSPHGAWAPHGRRRYVGRDGALGCLDRRQLVASRPERLELRLVELQPLDDLRIAELARTQHELGVASAHDDSSARPAEVGEVARLRTAVSFRGAAPARPEAGDEELRLDRGRGEERQQRRHPQLERPAREVGDCETAEQQAPQPDQRRKAQPLRPTA